MAMIPSVRTHTDDAKRILAAVFPLLPCELAKGIEALESPRQGAEALPSQDTSPKGMAVLLYEGPQRLDEGSIAVGEDDASSVIDAVDEMAYAAGVRPGHRVTEATAMTHQIVFRRLRRGLVKQALGQIAELAMEFGTVSSHSGLIEDRRWSQQTASQRARKSGEAFEPLDTVWVDISGAAHLFGGEERLCLLFASAVEMLGHRVSIAIADGPLTAQARARFRPGICPPKHGVRALEELPLSALPLQEKPKSLLYKLGIRTVRELCRLPRKELTGRLGADAIRVVPLLHGLDSAPLIPYEPPVQVVEEVSFDHGVKRADSLLFVARSMLERISRRLELRGQACAELGLVLHYDRSIAALRGVESELVQTLAFPAPLFRPHDLLRALKAKLERTELQAPAMRFELVVHKSVKLQRPQLDLTRERGAEPDAMTTLLAELAAEIGEERVGILELQNTYLPERRCRLVSPFTSAGRERVPADKAEAEPSWEADEPSRLLARPLRIDSPRVGDPLRFYASDEAVGEPPRFEVESIVRLERLEDIAWWRDERIERDYGIVRLRTRSPRQESASIVDAWVEWDRSAGYALLRGFWE